MSCEGVECCWEVINHMKSGVSDTIKRDFFPSCGCIHTTMQMHHINAEKMQDGNYTRMLCAVLNRSWNQQVAAVRPLASHLTNHWCKMNKTCKALLETQGETHKRHFINSCTWMCQCGLNSKDLHQLSGGAHCVIVIVLGNGHGNRSSNSRWGWLYFT